MPAFQKLRERARQLKRETLTLYLACRDTRTPWYAKILVGAIVAYALSPIDLIPDFVPILGYLDDVIIVPLGILLALKLVPPTVLAECREKAAVMAERPTSRLAAVIIGGVWVATAVLVIIVAGKALGLL